MNAVEVRRALEAIHCPSCGKVAAYTGIKDSGGFYSVAPVYCCDTEGCEYSLEGPQVWIVDLRG